MHNWQFPARNAKNTGKTESNWYLLEANQHLKDLLRDTGIPSAIKAELSAEFEEIEAISRKLDQEEIHIAAFGRVGVGKSSLLNALLQQDVFATSTLHGETRHEESKSWCTIKEGRLVLIDTPGIDELDGEVREEMAKKICRQADVILMVCDADLTDSEFRAMEELCKSKRTVLLILNKSDRYNSTELELLLQRLQRRSEAILPADRVIAAAAEPRPEMPPDGLMGLSARYTPSCGTMAARAVTATLGRCPSRPDARIAGRLRGPVSLPGARHRCPASECASPDPSTGVR